MFCKRMAVIHKKGKERLAELHEQHRAESERLLDVFGDVLAGAREATAPAEGGAAAPEPAALVAERAGRLLLKTLADAGGVEQLSAAHEVVAAHHGNNYLPLLEKFYKSHRSALFTLLDTLELEATSADHSVLDAVEFLRDAGPHRRVRPREGQGRARAGRGDGGNRRRLRHRGVAQDPVCEGAMLAVVYLVYTAGLSSPAEPGLCPEAIRLARILATLMPDEPEVAGLLALVLLSESRRACRTRPDGSLVLLSEQDRSRWDRALIDEGQAIVRRCLRRNQPGAYQLQAAINAVHADATAAEQTDWAQIVALYDHLLAIAATPVVALNRAIAIGEVHGPRAALALVDKLDLDNYHSFHATRADLLQRMGRTAEATAAYARAADLAPTDNERNFLRLGGRTSR
jgi:hypothetical protein